MPSISSETAESIRWDVEDSHRVWLDRTAWIWQGQGQVTVGLSADELDLVISRRSAVRCTVLLPYTSN